MTGTTAIRVQDSTVAIGLTPPVDNVPSEVTIRNRDNDVLHPGISSVLAVCLVIFHQVFLKGLQNVMPRSDYVSAFLKLAVKFVACDMAHESVMTCERLAHICHFLNPLTV